MSNLSLADRKKQFLEDCCGAAPTMSGGDGMYTSASPAEGPTAGYDPLLGGKKKRKVMDRVKELRKK